MALSQEELDAAAREVVAQDHAIEQRAGAKRIDAAIRAGTGSRQREIYDRLFGAPSSPDTEGSDSDGGSRQQAT